MYELLAVRELIEKNLIDSNYISPIIEPVRDNSTFNNLLKAANEVKYKLNVISNPQVGEYRDVDQLPGLIKDNKMKNSIIIQNNNTTVTISEDDLLFYDTPVEVLDDSNRNSTINVVQDSLVFNKSRIGNPKHVVVFNDCFNRQDRNTDYSKNQDENFSEYQYTSFNRNMLYYFLEYYYIFFSLFCMDDRIFCGYLGYQFIFPQKNVLY